MSSEMTKRILQSKLFLLLYMVISIFAICEIATRAFFAIEIGPRVLLYGTDWYRNVSPDDRTHRRRQTTENYTYARELAAHLNSEATPDSVEEHGNDFGSYSKFFPHEKKTTRDIDTGERIPVFINSHGFRGEEFERQKPPGTVRVLTLGSS